MADDTPQGPASNVTRFPQSRTRVGSGKPVKNLGLTALSKQAGSSGRAAMGHWCSRCEGIWYSYFLEAECPVCGNRHG